MKAAVKGIIILIILGIGAYFFFPHGNTVENGGPTPTVSTSPVSTTPVLHLPGKDISLLIADTEEKRELGLGQRASLPEDQAMIFIFDKPGIYEFWMKDMKFPIDIIWLDANNTIVYVESSVSPESYPDTTYSPDKDSLYVLEANAGFLEKNNLKVGDKLSIDLKK
jgi:uncharacterized membrane protein (UPF0127 family)